MRPQRGAGRARRSPAGATRCSWRPSSRSPHTADGPRIDGRPENVRALRRGQPAPAEGRRHRPLLPAPGRPEGADRGHRRRDGRAGRSRARCATSASPRPAPRPSAGPPPSTRSPRCRASGRCGRATWSRRCSASPASTASASCRSARSAAGSSPGRSPARPTSARTTSAATSRGSRARRSQANLRLVDAVRELAAEKGATPGQLALAWVLAAGRGRRPDPRHQAAQLPGGERGRGRRRAHRRRPRPAGLRSRRRTSPSAAATPTPATPTATARSARDERSAAGGGVRLAGVGGAAALGRRARLPHRPRGARRGPRPAATPADVTAAGFGELDGELAGGSADVVVTDHHRDELGELLRDALARPARWIGRHGQSPARGPARRGAHGARCAGRRHRPGAPADRAGHRLPGAGGDRRSPRWPGCSPTATAARGGFAHGG